jgi:hypothetical protein
MSDEELRPHVLRPRGRWIAAVLAAQLAAIGYLAFRAEHRPPAGTFAPSLTVISNATAAPPAAPMPPIVLPAPIAAAANRPSCPPARNDAPRVTPKLDEDIARIRPAPTNAGWIAAWNKDHVFVSYDAGATFSRALDGEDTVLDASFDCWGHLVVLRGKRVGVKDGAIERWHEVGGLRGNEGDPGGVIGGGPDVVVVGSAPGDGWTARAAVSADTGATWTYHDLGNPYETGMRLDGRQEVDGTIEIALSLADCMNDVLEWSTIRQGVVDRVSDGMPEATTFAIYGDLALDDYYWRTRGGERHELPTHPEGERIVVVPGAFPTLVAGTTAYRFDRGNMRALPVIVEGDAQAVDLAGRIWSIACGKPLVAGRTATGLPATCAASD